jgi:hypothetical protein
MSKRDAHRELFNSLNELGLLEYGSVIETAVVHELLGIETPAFGTRAQFDRLALTELAAIDYVRNILLGQGKYLSGTTGGYRILLPSENANQVELYIQSADKKLSRALKLSRNMPQQLASTNPDQTEARILMKRHGIKTECRPSI